MTARYSAWRFTFRGLEPQGAPAGLTLSPKGGIDLVNETDTVRQALLLLISTRPGERVMRPDYGCYLFRLTFSPNDDTTAGLAIHYVRQALDRWEPRINVLHVDASRTEEHTSRLDINLRYRLRTQTNIEQLTFNLDLRSGRIH